MTQAIYLPDQDEISRETLEKAYDQMSHSDEISSPNIILKDIIISTKLLSEDTKTVVLNEIDKNINTSLESLEKAWGIRYDFLEEILENTNAGQKLVKDGFFEVEVEDYYSNELTEQCFSDKWGFTREAFRGAILDNVDWHAVARDLCDHEEYEIGRYTFYVIEE